MLKPWGLPSVTVPLLCGTGVLSSVLVKSHHVQCCSLTVCFQQTVDSDFALYTHLERSWRGQQVSHTYAEKKPQKIFLRPPPALSAPRYASMCSWKRPRQKQPNPQKCRKACSFLNQTFQTRPHPVGQTEQRVRVHKASRWYTKQH